MGPNSDKKGPFRPVLALCQHRFKAGGPSDLRPGIFSARGRRGGAAIAFWVRVSDLTACVGASQAQTPYFWCSRAVFPCELAEKGRFGGVPKRRQNGCFA